MSSEESILAAAIGILQHEGAGAMTVRSVAKAAGCSTTGVYTWFGNKNGLVDAIFIDGFQRFGQALAATRRRPTRRQHLSSLADTYRRWALANPTHYMVMFGGAVPDFVPSTAAILAANATFEQLVAAIDLAAAEVQFNGTPAEIAHHLWAGIHGYVSLELSGVDRARNDAERARTFKAGLTRVMAGCVTAQ
jgi:AcrR family transcriptional regulator